MASIDDIKDKISDGEYLNMCNLIKALNESINTNTNTNFINAPIPIIDNNNTNINELIKSFLNDKYFSLSDEDKQNISMTTLSIEFNRYIVSLMRNREYRSITCNCPCGATFTHSDMLLHFGSRQHHFSFNNFITNYNMN